MLETLPGSQPEPNLKIITEYFQAISEMYQFVSTMNMLHPDYPSLNNHKGTLWYSSI